MRQFVLYERHGRQSGGLRRDCTTIQGAGDVRLTRVFVDAALTPGSIVELPPDTASHLAKVLRAHSGDEVILFNGGGQEFAGAIEAVRGGRVSASVGDGRP